MKKYLLIILSVVMMLTACEMGGSSGSPYSSDASISGPNGVKAEDIADAKALLDDPEAVRGNPDIVFSDWRGSKNTLHIDNYIALIKDDKDCSVTGFMTGTVYPFAYSMTYKSGGELVFWQGRSGKDNSLMAEEKNITDIYIADNFYQFTDGQSIFFSIAKVLGEWQALEGYLPDTDIVGAQVTAADAKEAASNMMALLSGYTAHASENNIENYFNGMGIVIPGDFSERATTPEGLAPTADGAVEFNGKKYYKVIFNSSEYSAGDTYLIGSDDKQDVYLMSMVDGSLIPICYENAEHISVKK